MRVMSRLHRALEDKCRLDVVRVEGRYPCHPQPLRSENITCDVSELEDGMIRIRIDDRLNDEAWFEITTQLRETNND